MKKFYFLLITLFYLTATSLRAQVTFTQTSNDDFTQGNSYGTVINNNAVVPEPSLVGGTLNDWEATTNIPATLYGHQLCTWRNYLYCIGGHNGSSVVNTVYRATFQNSGASNVGISGWTTLTALPVSLRDAAVVSTQNYLIVIGGHNADSICRNIYTAKFNSDGSVAGWSVSPVSLPQPMYGMRAVVAQGNLYIIGGTTSDNASGYSNKVYLGKVNALGELYELTETVTLPVALNRHAVATDGQHVYVTGGRNSSGTRLNSVLKATLNPDGTVNGWQVMAALPAETDGHSAVCSNGVLAVIGGEDNTGLASNKLYYTPTNGNAFNWNIADVFLSDRVKDAASVAYRSSIYVAGGVNMVGTILNYTRYAPITGSSQVTDATFISTPFLIGDPKTIQGLSYTLSNNTTDYQLLYRVAGMDKVYSNWTSTDNSNPLNINISGSFLQYMMRFTSSTGTQPTLEDMTLTLSGITQLSGNLNGMDTLKVENSPYWATGSISFTDGTHVIDSGVTIYFSPNTGLDITRANMKFNGTANAGITLTSYDHEVPNWNGVYFQDASDNGVSSIMNYTSIMYAGNGDNNANLRLYNTNQPVISHCNFQHADGHGLRLVNSHPTLSNCTFSYNTESGVYMEGANPTLNTATCDGNGFAGLYYANANVNPNLTDITLQNNLYGIYSHTPDNSFAHSGSIAMSGNGTDVAVNGGNINGDRRWGYFENGYALLSDVTIRGKLTIAPGNTLKMAQGKYLNIGWGGSEGGKLSAMGKADSLITFTSLNGAVGGWEGLFFRDGSDYNSSSTLRYCVVENGNDRNLYCENTTQPYILSCTFRNANNQDMRLHNSNITVESSLFQNAQFGINLYSSSPILISDTFEYISNTCVRMETNHWPNTYSLVMRNSNYGFHLLNPNTDIPKANTTFSNNTADIAVNGGEINNSRTWAYNETYSILGKILLCGQGWTPVWNINSGNTLKFATNAGLQIGKLTCGSCYSCSCYDHGGALHAIGTPDSLITFTALNDSIGGWDGIFFEDRSDNCGSDSSDLKYCIVEKSAGHNLNIENTRMPYIENCIFRLAQSTGVRIYGQYNREIANCVFEQNGGDGLYSYNASPTITNCTFNNNSNDGLYATGTTLNDISNSSFNNNGNDGLYATGSTLHNISNSSFNNNSNDGLYSENSLTKIHNSHLDNNEQYGLHFNNAYYVDTLTHLSLDGNSLDGIVIDGGTIEQNKIWFYNDKPYIFLSSITLQCYYCTARWNIKPGTTLMFAKNTGLQIGAYQRGGALHAIGTPDSLITFTALNDSIGGWNGIYFVGQSDDYGSDSSDVKYCIIEKGKDYNLHLNGTKMPYIENCTFRQAQGTGLWIENEYTRHIRNCVFEENGGYGADLYNITCPVSNSFFTSNSNSGLFANSSYINIDHSQFANNGQYGLYYNNANNKDKTCRIINSSFTGNSSDGLWTNNSFLYVDSSLFNNNGRYGLHYNNAYYVDTLTHLSFNGNNMDGIVIDGGTIEDNRTWFYCEKPYIFLGNITLRRGGWTPVWTIKPGCAFRFAANTRLQVGSNTNNYGTIHAIGAPDSLITFSALNDSIGGWNGILFNAYSDDAGGECYMTYVDVSQGKDYNIRNNATNFPTMEKCNIHHSLGNGMQIESSNCVIKSSTFHDNGNRGIFINGGNQPTIGGNYMTYCSFYNNQGYDVYQDGNQTINMPYSFFGCTDSLMVATKKIYDKADNSSKGEVKYWPVSWVPQSIGEDLQLDGTITYGEDGLLNNVTVKVQDFMNNNLLQTTVGATSDFHFSDVNLTTANHMVFEHPYSYADGAVNATDALKVMRHFTHQSLLSPTQETAADVNGSCTVNGTDAMLILKRYVGLLEEFPVGNCLYICDSVIANDNNFTYNTQMYWYGDVDFSYNFTRGDNSTVQLETYNSIHSTKNETIRIPVIAKGNYSLGAISLDILYPETEMEIVGVELHQTGDPMTFHTHDNSLRIGWYSLSPLAASYDDTLLYITARVLQNNPDIRFELGPCCALADGYAEPISGAVLAMPNISDILGVEDIQGGNTESVWEQVQVYPNPSHGTFTISDPEHVIQNLYLYDVCGKLVEIGSSYASESSIRISNLTPGVYFIRMEAEDSTKTLKVVVEK